MFTAVGPSVFSVFADTVSVFAFSCGSARFPALYRCWAAVWPFFFFIPFANAATILTTRLTLAITCLLVAVILHFALCQWLTSWSSPGEQLLTFEANNEMMGLFTNNVPRQDGWVYGVAAPILLLGIATSQIVAICTNARHRIGCCLKCGYELNQHTGTSCPECGHSRTR